MTLRPRPAGAQEPGPGQESVWDYPRPPSCDPSSRHVTVAVGNRLVADTARAIRVLETSHPPTWYLTPEDVDLTALTPSDAAATVCEYKGVAEYFDVLGLRAAAWRYPAPTREFTSITGFIAFKAGRLECRVDGQLVVPQPGGFYAGWITPDVVGPFKGGPGSLGW